MEEKLKELLDAIKYPVEDTSSFLNMSLKKVKVNKEKMHIILKSDNPLKLAHYIKFNECLNTFFNVNCILEIDIDSNNYNNIRECYEYIVDSLEIPFLKDRLKNNYNSFYIELNNESEKRQCLDSIKIINDKLMLMGYPKLEVMVNEFNRNKVENAINKDLKVKVVIPPVNDAIPSKPSFEARPKKIETVNDDRVVFGKVIEEEIVTIDSIVGEDVNIPLEAEVFGIEGFESTKSDYKVITLKITDYTNSIYAKIFTRIKDDYEKYISLFKEGKWFKFFGYTKIDQFSRGELVFNVQSVNYSNKKKEDIYDDAEEKRIELHSHTMMSGMDYSNKL